MRVRAFDSLDNKYFKSEVYATLCVNGLHESYFDKSLVVVPSPEGDHFKFLEKYDKSGTIYKSLMNVISYDRPYSELKWIHLNSEQNKKGEC